MEEQISVYPHEKFTMFGYRNLQNKKLPLPWIIFIFQENENYNLKSGTHVTNRNIHTPHFGTDNITNLGPKIWKLVPDEIKNASSLLVFKSRIKTWTTDNCPCRLCKTFVKDLGFI